MAFEVWAQEVGGCEGGRRRRGRRRRICLKQDGNQDGNVVFIFFGRLLGWLSGISGGWWMVTVVEIRKT